MSPRPRVNPTSLLGGPTKLERIDKWAEIMEQRWQGGHKEQASAPGPKSVGKDRDQEKACGHSGFCHGNAWVRLADVHSCHRSQEPEG